MQINFYATYNKKMHVESFGKSPLKIWNFVLSEMENIWDFWNFSKEKDFFQKDAFKNMDFLFFRKWKILGIFGILFKKI